MYVNNYDIEKILLAKLNPNLFNHLIAFYNMTK